MGAPQRLHLPGHDVLSFELVVLDPTSFVAVVWGSDIATIRLRIGLCTVGDLLVSSPTGVLLLNDGKRLQHSAPQPLRRLHRQLRHRLRLPQEHPADQWIPSTVPSIPWTLGPPTRKPGAAESTPSVALQLHRHRSPSSCQLHSLLHRPILTIALTASQTGRPVGQWPKRRGVAKSTARAVRIKAVAV